jgi:hypothetical protein
LAVPGCDPKISPRARVSSKVKQLDCSAMSLDRAVQIEQAFAALEELASVHPRILRNRDYDRGRFKVGHPGLARLGRPPVRSEPPRPRTFQRLSFKDTARRQNSSHPPNPRGQPKWGYMGPKF